MRRGGVIFDFSNHTSVLLFLKNVSGKAYEVLKDV